MVAKLRRKKEAHLVEEDESALGADGASKAQRICEMLNAEDPFAPEFKSIWDAGFAKYLQTPDGELTDAEVEYFEELIQLRRSTERR
jgi:hypothetical protein